MSEHVLMHIGMHKTGTTALQHALAAYDDGRIRYAQLGHSNHSIPVVTSFVSEPHRYHVWKRIGATREEVAQKVAFCRERLDAELALPRRRLLIVGEEISLLPTAAVAALTSTLHGSGAEVSVLAYLRDPLGYVTSAFQQQVRGGQSCYTLPRPYYRQRFEKFTAIFGRAAVSFRAYAPEHTGGFSIISDYSCVAGLAPGALAECHANPSLPLDAVRLIHLFNRTTPPIRSETGLAARSAMIAHLAACFTTRFTLDTGIVAAAVEAEDLAWVEDTTGIPFRTVPGVTDPTKAEAALAAYLDDIPPQAIDRLRHDLSLRFIPQDHRDDTASLLAKLYAGFLAAEDAKRAALAPKSASG